MYLLCRPWGVDGVDLFIKFISWNSLYIDFIQTAFPSVPTLYQYRNPAEVIVSVKRNTTAALVAKQHRKGGFLADASRSEVDRMDDLTYLSHCYAHYFRKILEARKIPALLDYAVFSKDRLPEILWDAFRYDPGPVQLERMAEQFDFYSKDDRQNAASFQADSEEKRSSLAGEQVATIKMICLPAWNRLRRTSQNIAPAGVPRK